MPTPHFAESASDDPDADPSANYSLPWVEIRFRVPGEWAVWLRTAAAARSLSVAALVRQLIRELMLVRHDDDPPAPPVPPPVTP